MPGHCQIDAALKPARAETSRAGARRGRLRTVPVMRRVTTLAVVPELLRRFDVDPAAVLHAVDLDSRALDDPGSRIGFPEAGWLLEECVTRTRCRHFGLLVGCAGSLDTLGIVGQLVRHSPTVGQALRSLVLNHQLNGEGGLVFLVERGVVVDFGYAISMPATRATEQVIDMEVAVALKVMRELCGPTFSPAEVLLPHAPPVDDGMFRSFFRGRIHYHAELGALRFPSHVLDQPVSGASPVLLAQAEAQAATLGGTPLVPRVYRALRLLLIRGRSRGDDVAAMLDMHRRTLNRRLEAEGTTFRDVLDDVRFHVACQLLSSTTLPADDIAAALAYDSLGAFMRSFKRWSGTTPRHWRRENTVASVADRGARRRSDAEPARA